MLDRKTSPNQRCWRRSWRRCSKRAASRLNGVSNWAETCLTKRWSAALSIFIPNTREHPYTAILHHAPISDPRAVYEQVKQEYASKFNVEVSAPLGFENTFAILVRGDDARRLNLKTISDAAPHAPRWRAGFGQDFMSRADGYPGFSKAYGLKFAEVREMDLSLTYIALSSDRSI